MSVLEELLAVIDTVPSWGRNLVSRGPGRVFEGTFDPSERATEEDVLEALGVPSNMATRFTAGVLTDPLVWAGGAGLATGALRGAAKTGARQVAGKAARGSPLKDELKRFFRSEQGSVPDPRGAMAFHGSPHRFDKFSTKHMGSGEGGQAYGWGLYFADEQDVARSYKQSKLAIDNKTPDEFLDGLFFDEIGKFPVSPRAAQTYYKKKLGRTVSVDEAEKLMRADPIHDEIVIADHLAKYGDLPSAERMIKDRYKSTPEEQLDQLLSGKGPARNKGDILVEKMYKMRAEGRIKEVSGTVYKARLAPKQDEYLLLDEPFEKQPPKVQQALRNIEKELKIGDQSGKEFAGKTGSEIYDDLTNSVVGEVPDIPWIQIGGREPGGPKKASLLLRKHGVRGNKFMDQFSRRGPNKVEIQKQIDSLQEEAQIVLKGKKDLSKRVRRGEFTQAEAKSLGSYYDTQIEYFRKEVAKGRASLENLPSPSYNYVIFDEADISIEQIMSMLAAGGMSAEIARQMLRERQGQETS